MTLYVKGNVREATGGEIYINQLYVATVRNDDMVSSDYHRVIRVIVDALDKEFPKQ